MRGLHIGGNEKMLNLDSLNKCARGHWQRWILQEWMEGKEVQSPVTGLRGKAKLYQGRYWASFQNLLARVRNAGFIVVRIDGVRGGEPTARYYIKKLYEV